MRIYFAIVAKRKFLKRRFFDLEDGRYIVCDPTYIGAPVGLAMPEYKGGDVEVDVVKIK